MATIDHVRHHHSRHGVHTEGGYDPQLFRGGPGEELTTLGGRDPAIAGERVRRARHEMHGNTDRMRVQADLKEERPDKTEQDRVQARVWIFALALTLTCMVPYILMIVMWLYSHHSSASWTIGMLVFWLLAAGIMIMGSYRQAMGKERPAMWWAGAAVLLGTLVGFVAGFLFYYQHLAHYYKYNGMRAYTDVSPAQEAVSFNDGAMYTFSSDAQLVTGNSVGYKSRWTGDFHCVAPIKTTSMSQADPIVYWAVGLNCCGQRGFFQCGDVGAASKSALVVLEPHDVAGPSMRWAVLGLDRAPFLEAISVQSASYLSTASANPKLVYWSQDPLALKDSYFSFAATGAWTVGIVLFFVSFALAFCVSHILMWSGQTVKSYLARSRALARFG